MTTEGEEKVAIKKIKKIFTNLLLARRTLRELKLLRHLNPHPNVPPWSVYIYVTRFLLLLDYYYTRPLIAFSCEI